MIFGVGYFILNIIRNTALLLLRRVSPKLKNDASPEFYRAEFIVFIFFALGLGYVAAASLQIFSHEWINWPKGELPIILIGLTISAGLIIFGYIRRRQFMRSEHV